METNAKGNRLRITSGEMLIPTLSALGIGILWGSWSATRDLNPFDNPLFVPAVPAITALLALVLAVIFRKRTVPLARLSQGTAILVAFGVTLFLVSPLVSAAERSALSTIALGTEGLVSALMMYIFLVVLIPQSIRSGAVSIAVGYLLVNLYDGAFMAAPDFIHLWQRPIALLVTGTLCVIATHKALAISKSHSTSTPLPATTNPLATAESFPSEPAASVHPGVITATTPTSEINPQQVPTIPWNAILLGIFVTVLLLIQGVYSQITGLGGIEGAHLFDMSAEIYVAALRLVIVVYCTLLTRRLLARWIALCAAVIWLIGIPLVTFLWGTDYWLIGSLSLNSGRYVLLPIMAIYGVQVAQRYPQKPSLIIFLAIAISYCCYVSRMAVLLFFPDVAAPDSQQLLTISLWSLWLVAVSLGFFLFFRQHVAEMRWHASIALSDKKATDEAATSDLGISPTLDPGLEKEIAFYRSFQIIADGAELTDREREVLNEALHGYSINNIAKHLNLSPQTIKTYLSRAYNRVGVTSKQAVLDLIDEEMAKRK